MNDEVGQGERLIGIGEENAGLVSTVQRVGHLKQMQGLHLKHSMDRHVTGEKRERSRPGKWRVGGTETKHNCNKKMSEFLGKKEKFKT